MELLKWLLDNNLVCNFFQKLLFGYQEIQWKSLFISKHQGYVCLAG